MKNKDEVILGVDVSSEKMDYYDSKSKRSRSVNNNETGCENLAKECQKLGVTLVVCEATGGYERLLAKTLNKYEIACSIQNPSKIRNFGRARGKLAKTDKIDAKLICEYGECFVPAPTSIFSEDHQELADLLTRRDQLVKIRVMEKARNKSPLASKESQESIMRILGVLKTEIKGIELRIEKIIASNQSYQEKSRILKTFKGVGSILAATLIAFLPEMGILDREQIAALVGVAPYDNQSGKKDGNRSIYAGRRCIRDPLYMAAISAIQFNPIIRSHYQKLRSRGKVHKVATVSCMRKIIVSLNAMLRDSKTWSHLRFAASKQDYLELTTV